MGTADSSPIAEAIGTVVAGSNLDEDRAYGVANQIMQGEATPVQIGALLIGLRMKGETVDEITGFARAMRDKVDRVPVAADTVVDTCGTGGDSRGTFNISTVAAFVAAGAGVQVAKHGNRSVSSKCGSSELLDELGVPGQQGPAEAHQSLDKYGIAFLFAPLYHKATRHAVGPRREIGVRSIFNAVGPLTNPAGARRQVLGVYDGALTEPLAKVLGRLGSTHCMVVHGNDGLDEITLTAPTRVSELKDGAVRTFELDPAELGFEPRTIEDLAGGDPTENARIAREVLAGKPGAAREICILNAGAAVYVAGLAPTLAEGVARATDSIDSGNAQAKLDALVGGDA